MNGSLIDQLARKGGRCGRCNTEYEPSFFNPFTFGGGWPDDKPLCHTPNCGGTPSDFRVLNAPDRPREDADNFASLSEISEPEEDAANRRPGQQIIFPSVEPWGEPVDGATIANELLAAIDRHVVMPTSSAIACALWVLFTHVYEDADVCPLLILSSPTKRCGKTTTIRVLSKFASRPLPSSNITSAALFRVLEASRPTLFVDEADTFLGARDELRGILNSGHTADAAFVIRTVGDGANAEVRQFRTWGPKALAAIGRLPDTLVDRGIVVQLERRRPEDHIEPLRGNDGRYADLRRKLERWAIDSPDAALSTVEIPGGLDDRAGDNWEPLISIAANLGGNWPNMAHAAAVEMAGRKDDHDDSAGPLLLGDLRDLFERHATKALSSQTILDALTAKDDRPWPEWRHGKPLTSRGLAKLLSAFGIRPKTVRIGEKTPKGYEIEQFSSAFARYLPPVSATAPHPAPDAGLNGFSSATPPLPVADRKRPDSAPRADCGGVADRNPLVGEAA